MEKYHKIQTVYLRDPETKFRTLLDGQWALPEFEYLAENEWIFTEKIDGTNIRIDWNCEKVSIGGRTDNAQIPAFLVVKLMDIFPADKFIGLYPELPMTIYGEGYGAKIQKGGGNYIPDGVDFIAFDVLINGNYQERKDLEDIAGKLGVDVVPVVGVGSLRGAVEYVREGFNSYIGTQEAEGLVMRPATELRSRTGQRIISKIKHKDFAK